MQAAMALLGARKLHENNTYVMQMNRQSQRPDVIAATRVLIESEPTIKISPLEITEMESHTEHQDLALKLLDGKNLSETTINIGNQKQAELQDQVIQLEADI